MVMHKGEDFKWIQPCPTGRMLGPYITSIVPYFCQCNPLIVIFVPCNPHIIIIVPLNYYCQVGQDYIVAPTGLNCDPMDSYIQKLVFVICIIQELFIHVMYWRFPPSKWLISKALISLFFYFWSWFHNKIYVSLGYCGLYISSIFPMQCPCHFSESSPDHFCRVCP